MQYKNVHLIPKVTQVTVMMTTNIKPTGLDNPVPAAFLLELMTGQRAKLTRVRKYSTKLKIRPGTLLGAAVTLHGDVMYHFLDKVVTQVLPRVADFNGLNNDSFDRTGNYGFTIYDVSNFLEVESQYANLQPFGLNQAPRARILVATSAQSPEEGRLLLSALRFPFAIPKK